MSVVRQCRGKYTLGLTMSGGGGGGGGGGPGLPLGTLTKLIFTASHKIFIFYVGNILRRVKFTPLHTFR